MADGSILDADIVILCCAVWARVYHEVANATLLIVDSSEDFELQNHFTNSYDSDAGLLARSSRL